MPKGIVSTAFPATEATCRRIGILFDPWQCDLNRCLLAKDITGMYAADTVALSIPRQVGKTFDVGGVVFADSIINPGTTTVWTAHRFKVARESFNEMRGWAKTSLLKAHIDYDDITTAAGNECIPFRNGSRIVFAARERGAIRGFTKVRRLILDEAQILTEHALSDLAPTQNQAVNPQIIFMGTPPKPTDPGEVFTRLRTEAVDGTSDGVLYVEFSAPRDADLDDQDAWRIANPSFPRRTPEKAMLRLRKLLSDDNFRREALGIWDDVRAGWRVFPQHWWAAAELADVTHDSPPAIAVDVTPDRSTAAIGAAAARAGGGRMVDVFEHRPGGGVRWVLPVLKELEERYQPLVIVINDKALADEAEDAGLKVHRASAGDVAAGAAALYDGIAGADEQGRDVKHPGRPELTSAAAGATTRTISGTQSWAYDRSDASVDISPLVAASIALWALGTPRIHVERTAFFGAWR